MNGSPFNDVARRAIQRISLARWFEALASSALVVFPLLAALALVGWLTNVSALRIGVWQGVAVVAGWIVLTGLWTRRRRPDAVSALALWDERTGRDEVFTSALCFESLPEPGLAEQLHLRRATQQLAAAEPQLKQDLPAPLRYQAWLLPIAVLVLVAVIPAQPASTGEQIVDQAERERALEASEELARQAELDHIETAGLDEEEKDKLKELEDALKESTERLKELEEGESARDVLSELEAMAHEAEKLSEALEGDSEGLSSEMIAELERHADTTDFGSALRSEDLGDVADEAEAIEDRLKDKELSREEEERMEESLRKAMKKADQNDKQTLAGKELEEALQRLTKDQPKQAAKNFENIARNALQKQQRQLAQQQLKQLAQQLRKAGQQIFQNKQGNGGQGIQKLAQLKAQGLKPLQAGQQVQIAMPNGQRGQNQGMPVALGQPQPGNQKPGAMIPVPGQPGQGQPQGVVPGTGQGQTPVPGAGGAPVPGSGGSPVPGSGGAPVPGSGGAPGAGAGVGGLQAGTGSAGYGNTATKAMEAKKQGTVQGVMNSDGESMVREIDPSAHREEAGRDYQQRVAELLRLEEEALADEPLPASRRLQVLQYLTTLRRQLVDQQPDE